MFIASFFVTLSAPSFSFRTNRGYRYAELQRLRIENRELRETNCRQRRELEELRRQAAAWDNAEIQDAVPPVNLDVPPPPPPPRAPKFIR
jgi:hypothetical protein